MTKYNGLLSNKKYHFPIMLVIAVVILQLPIISIPFKWLESYFHEISHGLIAIATGGKIVSIQLFPNGAGLCTSRGGISFLIAFMGYIGAIAWGTMIYLLSSINQQISRIFSIILLSLFALSILLWVRDLLTLIIILFLAALVFAKLKYSSKYILQKTLQMTGLLVLINSVLSPLYLIDGRNIGDGAALAEITLIPEIVWVIVWCATGIYAIHRLANRR